jgi:hypothetical protein
VAERAGVPTASLVCEGFRGQAATTADPLEALADLEVEQVSPRHAHGLAPFAPADALR